jgi:PhzF family phenazine biosynthesis protein
VSGSADVLRYAAFSVGGLGGNPAGVVLDASGLSDSDMQEIAAEVGYSETAFFRARPGEPRAFDVRYFAPLREVPFCGHATIASAVAIAERTGPGELQLHTPAGLIQVLTASTDRGWAAELLSVPPRSQAADPALVHEVLEALRWSENDLDEGYQPALAYAGASHLILVTRTRERLADLDYDFDRLALIMQQADLVTVALVWPETATRYSARNPFAGSGVVEDPATGAAAAALGGYLRDHGFVADDATVVIEQGVDMGRRSELIVRLVPDEPGVRVSGTAARI